jgi:hypothetical protein
MKTLAMTTITTKPCMMCRKVSVVSVPAAGLEAFDNGRGALIQHAFPDLSADDRELLLSGAHPACWDSLFAVLDEG